MSFVTGVGSRYALLFLFDRKLDVLLNAMELSWDWLAPVD